MSQKLSIASQVFEVSTPYSAGHQIDEREARVLNQTRAENVGNNMRAEVKERLEKGESLDIIAHAVAEYDGKYTFAMGGASRTPVDPLEAEARRVAKEAIKEYLAEQGRKLKDIDPEKLESNIAAVAQQDDTIAEAKRRLKAKQKKAAINLSGILDAPAAAA